MWAIIIKINGRDLEDSSEETWKKQGNITVDLSSYLDRISLYICRFSFFTFFNTLIFMYKLDHILFTRNLSIYLDRIHHLMSFIFHLLIFHYKLILCNNFCLFEIDIFSNIPPKILTNKNLTIFAFFVFILVVMNITNKTMKIAK